MFYLEMLRKTYMMAPVNLKMLGIDNQGNVERCTQVQSWRFSFTTESYKKPSFGWRINLKISHLQDYK